MRNYKNIAYEEIMKEKKLKRIKNWLYATLMLLGAVAVSYFGL